MEYQTLSCTVFSLRNGFFYLTLYDISSCITLVHCIMLFLYYEQWVYIMTHYALRCCARIRYIVFHYVFIQRNHVKL